MPVFTGKAGSNTAVDHIEAVRLAFADHLRTNGPESG
jgi:hypothetical protein